MFGNIGNIWIYLEIYGDIWIYVYLAMSQILAFCAGQYASLIDAHAHRHNLIFMELVPVFGSRKYFSE